MHRNNESLSQLIRQDVPENFFRDVVVFLFSTYKSVYDHVDSEFGPTAKRFLAPEARNLLPYYRCARIEQGLRFLAQEYQKKYESINVKPKPNDANNFWYNEITSGRILLTQSHVNGPNEIVRTANFRNTLARGSQYELFDTDDTNLGDFYYGIILHGSPDPVAKYPNFVRLAFPSNDCNHYIGNIDLIKLTNFDASKYLSIGEEKIDDKILKPELRNDFQKQKEG